MTPYDLLRRRCGLSQAEAAAFHGVRLDTIKSWCSGRNRPAAAVLAELRSLHARIERVAAEALAAIDGAPDAEQIELGFAADDHEAQALGWPCVGAQAASLGLVLARCDRPIRLVPRGSTLATAAAAEAHRR
jgi:transcriptional regulator with XRE-family HTH domain